MILYYLSYATAQHATIHGILCMQASSQQHQQRAQAASTQHQPSSIVPDKVAAIPWQPPDEPPEGCDPDLEIFEGLKRIFRDPKRFPPQTKSDEVLKAAGYSCWQEYYFSMMCFYAE